MKSWLCTCEWGHPFISHKHWDYTDRSKRAASYILNCDAGSPLFKTVHWCNLYDFLIKLQKLWSDGNKRTGLSWLTSSWTSYWAVTLDQNWAACSRESLEASSFNRNSDLNWKCMKTKGAWGCMCKCACDWEEHIPYIYHCFIKFILLTQITNSTMHIRQTINNVGVSLEVFLTTWWMWAQYLIGFQLSPPEKHIRISGLLDV